MHGVFTSSEIGYYGGVVVVPGEEVGQAVVLGAHSLEDGGESPRTNNVQELLE